jgi:hypothetical protein
MFVERLVSYSRCKQNMTSFRGQASWAKMTSPWSKLTALACHPTKQVNKAEEQPNSLQTLMQQLSSSLQLTMYKVKTSYLIS